MIGRQPRTAIMAPLRRALRAKLFAAVALGLTAIPGAASAQAADLPAGTPPPPASLPVAPPVPPGPFMIWFDWDETDIMAQSVPIIANAAGAFSGWGSPLIVVAGFADRSGPADYNVRLSQRRADRVRELLAARGVPVDVMKTEACGESRPLVETADGVREARNRRVEITLRPSIWGAPDRPCP